MGQRVRARARARRGPARDLARAAYDEGLPGPARPELGFGGEHGKQPREITLPGRGQERVDDLPGRCVRGRRRRAQPDPSAGPAGQHLRRPSAPAQDRGDRVERDLEHVVEHERDPFGWSEGIHDDVQRNADGVREQGFFLGIDPGGPGGLRREHSERDLERLLGPHSAPAERVQADPAGHCGEPAAQVLEAAGTGPRQSQPRLLDGVVRVGVRAEHAERDRVEIGALGLEFRRELFLFGHGSPWRTAVSLPGRTAGR